MVQLKPPRQAEFKRLRDRLIDGAVNGPIGNRHFWHGDYMVHRREGFMVSVRMNSLRVLNTEVLHDENLQNAHQADGVMQILRTGREYEGILPVWDWRRLPGITCRREPGPLKPARVDLEILRKTRFVGGVSDGTWGLAAFDFRREGLIGRKSWFCFDREIVCLGAGISCSTGNPVVTSVNQSLLRTKILIADERSRKEQKAGRTSIDGIRWVHHDATGYLFIGAHRVTAASEMQRGSWHDLSAHYPEEETVRNRVFSLWIEHGENPEGGSYAYAVLPGIKVREMDRYQENLPVRILSNLPELQAVHHEGIRLTQIAFYGSGELQIPEGPVVSVDRPCLIMLHRTGKGFNLSVSNPENEPCTVNVAISARLTGPGCRWHGRSRAVNVRVELPSGIHAGRSVVVPLERWKS
jgi:chondroitin AC lyase